MHKHADGTAGPDNDFLVEDANGAVKLNGASDGKTNGHILEQDHPRKKKDPVDGVRKPAKRHRTQLSRPRKRRRQSPEATANTVETVDSQQYGMEDDPNKNYCYCQKPYSDSAFYIQCDGCDEWFHGSCADVKEEDVDAISLWFCKPCEQATGKRSVWKQTCEAFLFAMREANSENPFVVLSACKKYIDFPASSESVVPSQEAIRKSRFCSSDCGMAIAQHRLQSALNKGLVPRRSTAKAGGEVCIMAGKPVSRLPLHSYKADEAKDLKELDDMKRRRERSCVKIRSLERRLAFIDSAVKRASTCVDAADGIPYCGFDSRIVMDPPDTDADADDNDNDKDGKESSGEGLLPTMCSTKGKCIHEGWHDLKTAEVELELRVEVRLEMKSFVARHTYTNSASADSKKGDIIPSAANQASFIHKLYTMLEDVNVHELICWDPTGTFVRQLNMYGFHKINDTFYKLSNNSEIWEFKHPDFRRGEVDLLQNIKRKAPSKASSGKTSSVVVTDPVMAKDDKIDSLSNKVIELEEKLAKLHESYNLLWSETVSCRLLQSKHHQVITNMTSFLASIYKEDADRKRKFDVDILQAEVAKLSPAAYVAVEQPGSPKSRMNGRGEDEHLGESEGHTRSSSSADGEDEDGEEDYSPSKFKRTNDYQKAETLVKQFAEPGGLGEKLQARLVDLDENAQAAWANRALYQKTVYSRDPYMANANFWMQLKNHPLHPEELLNKPPPRDVLSSFQIERAAGLIFGLIQVKEAIEKGTFSPDHAGNQPLCMEQYTKIFGSHRTSGTASTSSAQSNGKHIIVIVKDQLFKVPVYRGDGSKVIVKDLERLLYSVSKESLKSSSESPVGLMTAASKSLRLSIFSELMKLDKQNEINYKDISSALFVVSLDGSSSKREFDKQIFHNFDGRNRWFDKGLQLIVAPDGRAGINGDSMAVDVTAMARIAEAVVAREPFKSKESNSAESLIPPARLTWVVNDEIRSLLKNAGQEAKTFSADSQCISLDFEIFGTRYIQEIVKCSPDAFFQIALLITWRRLHEVPAAAGETVSLRGFSHGRTTVGRTLTEETNAFVSTFDDDNVLYDDKRVLFTAAVRTLAAGIAEASTGKGMDGHLRALAALVEKNEISSAELFDSKAYKAATRFGLFSSNISPADHFTYGFSPLAKKGYGIAYNLQRDKITATISNRNSSSTSAYKFKETLERTLKDMTILFPKRSEIWGPGWRKKHENERKNEYYLRTMRQLSDEYAAKRSQLARKYIGRS
ncbi:hypothetical protein HDU67_000063 [Dinochytrium kinnereticum]|nr:hypothetical protein HDU67_000063 [Dinochytrium kinnereticum]